MATAAVGAQATGTLYGVVLNASNGARLGGAEVRVEAIGRLVVTDSLGRFVFVGLQPGPARFSVRRLGYIAQEDTVTVRVDSSAVREVRMVQQPISLDTVSTTARARPYISPSLRAFEERRRMGIGRFITDSTLRKNDQTTLATALRILPGTRIQSYRASSYLMSSRGKSTIGLLPRADPADPNSPRGCWVAVYQDGIAIYSGDAGSAAPDLQRLQVREYGAVEYYAGGASKPVQYSGIKASDCGVLLLWTRER
jgi:hypothetical protein